MNTFSRRILFVFATIGLLSACSKEDKPSDSGSKTVRVTGVTLNLPSAAILEGETLTLTATVAPQDATNKKVSWASSNSAVATVQEGTVSAVKAGSATITVTTEDGGFKAECAVTVNARVVPSVTVGSEKISAISAVLKGKANFEGSTVPADLKVGFQYSASADLQSAKTVEATDADADYNYSAGITGLEPSAKYYFRSFVHKGGQDAYGEIMEFTTGALSSLLETMDAGSIEETSAVLNAKLDLTDVQYTNVEYGFYWGTSADTQSTSLEGGAVSESRFSASLTGLTNKTQYWYKAYLSVDGRSFLGEVKSFSTSSVAVQSVSLDKTEYSFDAIGGTLSLTATVLPEDASDKGISWASDNTAVATVDDNGLVTAVGNGKANITVTTADQGKTASCAITVAQKVSGISLDKSEYAFDAIGESITLSATVLPDNAANKNVEWSSDNTAVATVDNAGKVTAVGAGSANITVTTADQGKTASCTITVAQKVTGISLDKSEYTFDTIGETITLVAGILPENAANKNVSWSSDNTSVATVDNNGKVKAIGNGKANITVTTADQGKTASCAITVAQKVTGVSLDRTSATILEGENIVLTPTVAPANAANKNVVWTTSDAGVATVSGGTVTGVSAGSATITATTSDGGFTAQCSVTVTAYMPVLDATVAEVIAAGGGKFRVKGAVIAKADKGFIINDGGDRNLYVFYDDAAIESGVVVGASVSVEGTHSVSGGVVQLREPSSSVLGEPIAPKAQEPVLVGDYAIDTYRSSHSALIKVIGDYSVEAGAHTLTFSATSKGQLVPGSVTGTLTPGTRYAVSGYFVGSNGTTFSILPVTAEVSNERIFGNVTIENYEFDGDDYAW